MSAPDLGPSLDVPASLRRSLFFLSCATFSSMVAQRLCDAMLPELSREFGATLTESAQTVSVFAVAYGLAQLIYGPLGDRLGKFKVITFATLACSVGSVLSVFAPTLWVLVLARVLVALGAAAIIPMSIAWVGDSVPYEKRQETLARLSLGSTMGIVGGQLFGGVFTDTLGWRWAFVLMTAQFGGVAWLLFRNWRSQGFPGGNAPSAHSPGFVTQALHMLRGPWVRVVLLTAFIEGATGFGMLALWASHLHHALGLSLSASGGVAALFGLGGVGYILRSKPLIARLGEAGLSAWGAGVMGLFAVVLAWTPVWWLAVPACLLAGFGFFMFHNTMQTNASQMAPTTRGTAMSSFAACLFMGQSVGVIAAASLTAYLGSAWVITLGALVMAVLGWVFGRRIAQRDIGA